MTFAEAMKAVKDGKKVRREGWREGSYIFLKPGDPAAEKIEDKPRIDLMKGGEVIRHWMYRPNEDMGVEDVNDWVEVA